jgi:hypothetical protein
MEYPNVQMYADGKDGESLFRISVASLKLLFGDRTMQYSVIE